MIITKELYNQWIREYPRASMSISECAEYISDRAAAWAFEQAAKECLRYDQSEMTAEYNSGCVDCATVIRDLIKQEGKA